MERTSAGKLKGIVAGTVLLAMLAVLAGGGTAWGAAVGRIFTQGKYGVSEAPPAAWGAAGKGAGLWPTPIVVVAQPLDANGRKTTASLTLTVPSTGQTAAMTSANRSNRIYQQKVATAKNGPYPYTVSAGGKTARATVNRKPMLCGNCHASLPVHAGGGAKCLSCHPSVSDVALKVHNFHNTQTCVSCHAAGFAGADRHIKADPSRDCTFCHDTASFGAAAFKRPNCASCHDADHEVPAGATYATAVGHGGMLCSTCHGSPHKVVKPANLGDGVNNNCVKCHADKVSGHNGLNCGACHGTSTDPHLAHLP